MNITPQISAPFRPDLSLPEEEGQRLREAYSKARVILEYGSGGSTVIASEMADKLIFSVESDRKWAHNLQHYIDSQNMPSPAVMHFVDIGPVGAWGRPIDAKEWPKFHHYPLDIWDQPFFRHPDVVLIDGRFRAACLAITRLKIQRPVTVLFDDYESRPLYHEVERLVGVPQMVGRMAVFELEPAPLTAKNITELMALMTQATYVKGPRYAL
jgi:hypothetical protein